MLMISIPYVMYNFLYNELFLSDSVI